MSPGTSVVFAIFMAFVVIGFFVAISAEAEHRRTRRMMQAGLDRLLRDAERRTREAQEAYRRAHEAQQRKQAQVIQNHWRILGINPTRDCEAVKKAFKRQALKAHPDHGGTNAAFVKLSQARDMALKECA